LLQHSHREHVHDRARHADIDGGCRRQHRRGRLEARLQRALQQLVAAASSPLSQHGVNLHRRHRYHTLRHRGDQPACIGRVDHSECSVCITPRRVHHERLARVVQLHAQPAGRRESEMELSSIQVFKSVSGQSIVQVCKCGGPPYETAVTGIQLDIQIRVDVAGRYNQTAGNRPSIARSCHRQLPGISEVGPRQEPVSSWMSRRCLLLVTAVS